eukprot:763046-Hanusia_phi.AAC.2
MEQCTESTGQISMSSGHNFVESAQSLGAPNQVDTGPVLEFIERPLQTPLKIVFPDISQFRMRESLKLQHVVFRRVWETGYSLSRFAPRFVSRNLLRGCDCAV